MERSVLEMLSDRSSAPTLLGCRPSARKSLGHSQKRFQLLTKSSFWSLHHDNNHLFKANSLLNLSCPRRYVGRGPGTMIVVAGDVLCTVSIRLLKSLFSVSVCRSLVLFTPVCCTTDPTLSSPFWVCTLPSANVAQTCRTMESPMITASCSVSNEAVVGGDLKDQRRWRRGGRRPRGLDRFLRCCTQDPWFPGDGVKDIWEDRVPGTWGLCRETHRVEVLAAHCILTPDLWVSARDVSSIALRSLSWACFPSSSWIRLSTASSSSYTECSSNMSSPALKGRHKSAIKASNSETMVNVCE